MANVLAQPGTTAAIINPSLNAANGTVGSSGSLFKIHMTGYDVHYHTPREVTTGDGDTVPVVKSNLELHATYRIFGGIIASNAVGFANMVANNSGPTGNKEAVSFTIARESGREENVTALVHDFSYQFRRGRALIPCTLICTMTNTTPGNIETST